MNSIEAPPSQASVPPQNDDDDDDDDDEDDDENDGDSSIDRTETGYESTIEQYPGMIYHQAITAVLYSPCVYLYYHK